MRLVTSCPACNTLFHVRQEQLSQQQTEVRCGQCREVFSLAPRLYALLEPQPLLGNSEPETPPAPLSPDSVTTETPIQTDTIPEQISFTEPDHVAESELQAEPETLLEDHPLQDISAQHAADVEEVPVEEVPVEEVPVEEVPVEEVPVEEVPVEEVPVEEVPVEEVPVEEVPVEEVPVEEVPVEEVPVEEVPVEEVQPEDIPLAETSSGDIADDLSTPVSADSASSAGDSRHAEHELATTNAEPMPRQRTETLEVLLQPPRIQAEPEVIETSFLDDRERLHTPLLPRWLAVILAVLLSLGLLAQSSYIFRTELASHWPASKPWLVSACTWLGCTVPLARHAELLALDDSDLQENLEHPEVIQLSTTLINNAAYTQAYPLLELTLTDDDDQPRLRRIFTPKEYLRAEADIEAGLPANEEIQIKLSLSTSDVVVSGYRVFVTY